MRAILTTAVGVLAISAVACGGGGGRGGGPGNGAACGAGRTGVTDCFTAGGSTCSAGQFCDMSSGFNACEAGCTSDTNCAAGDRCERGVGAAVGVCAPCTPTAVTDAGPPASLIGACQGAVDELGLCDVISAPEVAEGRIACETTLTDLQRRALIECVNGAFGDCTRMDACVSGPGPGPGPVDAGPPSDTSLANCLERCDAYAFFECFEPGGLDACRISCPAATMGNREQFVICAGSGSVSCDASCFDFLP